MSYEIEQDVPVPAKQAGAPTKYPFTRMDVGDSVKFPEGAAKLAYAAAKAMQYKNKKRNLKFRGVTEEDGGMRIWRTE